MYAGVPRNESPVRSASAVGLEIAVQHARRVCRRHPAGDRLRDPGVRVHRDRPVVEHARERAGVEQLHREVVQSRVLAEVERADDVRAGHAPRELDLLLEPLERARLPEQVAAHDLERDRLVERAVVRLVDLAHAARAQ
jgi:hypothetical protein